MSVHEEPPSAASALALQATLSLLLDHLSLVASFSSFNRMTHQNLAVCFGPVLLTPTQEAWRAAGGLRGAGQGRGLGEEFSNAVDFKRNIEALHYLLQLWPGETPQPPPTPHPPVIHVFDLLSPHPPRLWRRSPAHDL